MRVESKGNTVQPGICRIVGLPTEIVRTETVQAFLSEIFFEETLLAGQWFCFFGVIPIFGFPQATKDNMTTKGSSCFTGAV